MLEEMILVLAVAVRSIKSVAEVTLTRIDMRRTLLWISAIVMIVTFTACNAPNGAEEHSRNYIKALLDSTYKQENEKYIELTGADKETAQANNIVCVDNTTVHFSEKYELYLNQEQMDRMDSVFREIYLNSNYKVNKTRKTENGYLINVEYFSIDSIQKLESEIKSICQGAGKERNVIGAEYINDIIDLCEQNIENLEFKEKSQLEVDIIVTEKGEYLLNLELLQTLDDLVVLI